MKSESLESLGIVSIRDIDDSYPRPESHSVYEDWGDFAPEAKDLKMSRWLVELRKIDGEVAAVGDMSAHSVWYGPTPGSRAMNIGITLVKEYRGLGIGSIAQRLVANELHSQGIVRVEAGTDVSNIAEQHSLAKAGFIYEGTARQAQARANGLHDLQVWSHI
jgi:RimJ/RimL family protein N-acetyltransferase